MPKPATNQRLDQHDRDLAKHDRQIAAIRALILSGMRIVNKTAALQAETRKDLKVLEKKMEALIDALRRGTNGHAKRRMDIQ
jgi:hypothetical protein